MKAGVRKNAAIRWDHSVFGTPERIRTAGLPLRSLENSISQGASQCHVVLKSTVKSRELNNPSILEFLVRTPRITSKNLRS